MDGLDGYFSAEKVLMDYTELYPSILSFTYNPAFNVDRFFYAQLGRSMPQKVLGLGQSTNS